MTPAALVEAPAPLIHIADRGAIRVVTLANPQRRNPLSTSMIAALHGALRDAGQDSTVRVVLLAHEGPAFSAGHDLREIQAARATADHGRSFFTNLMAACSAMMLQIRAMPQPVIAVVEGVATAAGCQLVATCDLAIAGAEARFATPGVNIGLFCSTPMVALSRNISPKHAMEMLLTGDLVDAATAARFGLVNRVVPAGMALAEAEALARQIAGKPAAVLKIGKEAFYRQNELDLEAAYAYAGGVMVENMLMLEAQEGIAAFVAPKR
ncbi:MAG: enoyl-CoA hydratase [Beijerinckiaceae bacterium]|nr:enoyl-CoA hydratase [Beijerinckiaceae bacterium]MCZ8301483.1 enoyl-CoA hydratase [Beijerinckiaceae bacterium]